MSGNYYDNPDHDENVEDNSGGGLRKQLEAALEREKRYLKQLEGDRTKKATELLQGKGIDPGVIALVPEGDDPVDWVEKNSHLLGAQNTEQDETVIDQPEVTMAPDDDPALVAEREALAAMQDAAGAGSQSSVVTNDLLEGMSKLNSEEELLAFFKANGGTG